MNITANRIVKKISWYKRQLKTSSMTSWYVFCINNFKLNSRAILLQSRYGDDFGGNIFYILKELSENHKDYKLYLAYKQEKKNYT